MDCYHITWRWRRLIIGPRRVKSSQPNFVVLWAAYVDILLMEVILFLKLSQDPPRQTTVAQWLCTELSGFV
jgi:hypothetical protein